MAWETRHNGVEIRAWCPRQTALTQTGQAVNNDLQPTTTTRIRCVMSKSRTMTLVATPFCFSAHAGTRAFQSETSLGVCQPVQSSLSCPSWTPPRLCYPVSVVLKRLLEHHEIVNIVRLAWRVSSSWVRTSSKNFSSKLARRSGADSTTDA